MTAPIDAPQARAHAMQADAHAARRAGAPSPMSLPDDLLLDELRKNATVTTRTIRLGFVEVATRARVLGYVGKQRKEFVALRGDDPAWAHEIGRYPSESLAVEALRMRRA